MHVHIPTDANSQQVNGRSKLDACTIEGIFIGYLPSHGGHGGYRILLSDGRIMKSKDIEFIEGTAHRTIHTNEDESDHNDHNVPAKGVPATMVPATPPATQNTVPVTMPTNSTPPTTVKDKRPRIPELPDVSAYWKPTHKKQVPKPTEKVRAAFAAYSPTADNFIQLNKDLDVMVNAMTTGYRDMRAPKNQKEAYKLNKDCWVEAELAELHMLKERNTWELMPPPDDKNITGSWFTYAVKTTGDRQWYKDKARFIL